MHPIGDRRARCRVNHHHARRALLPDLIREQLKDARRRIGIEIASRFVGKDQGRSMNQRARSRPAAARRPTGRAYSRRRIRPVRPL